MNTSPVLRGHQGRQPSYIRILNLEKILYKILTCHGGNLFEECPSIHEVHESWYHLPIIQSLFYTTFLNNLFTKTRAVFKICFDCFWILEPWLSFLVVWSIRSCSICEFDFLCLHQIVCTNVFCSFSTFLCAIFNSRVVWVCALEP